MTNSYGKLQVFANNAGMVLAQRICGHLDIQIGAARVERFNDNEVDVQLLENVRDNDLYIVAPTHAPAENLIEAIWLLQAARLSSAARVTYVIPYMGYARSDRKDSPRKPIGAPLALRMLEAARPNRFIFLDIHAEQSIDSFERAVPDHLFGSAVAIDELKRVIRGRDFVIASPDKGGTPRAEKYADLMGQDECVVFLKKRVKPGEIDRKTIRIIGDVEDKDVIFVDDIIDTGGTIVADALAAKKRGARNIYVFATHGIFSKNALAAIAASPIERVYVTDSIYHDPALLRKYRKVKVLSVSELLARAIRRTHDGESISELIR